MTQERELALGLAYDALGNQNAARMMLESAAANEPQALFPLAALLPPEQALSLMQPYAQDLQQDPLFLSRLFEKVSFALQEAGVNHEAAVMNRLGEENRCRFLRMKGAASCPEEPAPLTYKGLVPSAMVASFPPHPVRDLATEVLEAPKENDSPLERLASEQRASLKLERSLPFVNPYKDNLYLIPMEFQKRLNTLKKSVVGQIIQKQEELYQEEKLCPDILFGTLLDHLEAGFGYSELAVQKMSEKQLPYVEVIPLQTLALFEFEQALSLFASIDSQAFETHHYETLFKSKEQERLKEMIDLDEKRPAFEREIYEGAVW